MFSAIRAWLPPTSIRARLTLWYLLFLAGALAALAGFVLAIQARTLHRELDAELGLRANQFASDRLPLLLGLDVGRALADDAQASSTALLVRSMPGSVLFRSAAFPDLGWAGGRA